MSKTMSVVVKTTATFPVAGLPTAQNPQSGKGVAQQVLSVLTDDE